MHSVCRFAARRYCNTQIGLSARSLSSSSSSSKPLSLKPLNGFRDLLPRSHARMRAVQDSLARTCESYGYNGVTLPTLEPAQLFIKGLGANSEVIGNKQNYSFTDQGQHELVVRPEGTASALRALLCARQQRSSEWRAENRVFYQGPMFRRERPQRGRHREFYQFGCELIGGRHGKGVDVDFEVLALAHACVDGLALSDAVECQVNDIGTSENREAYAQALQGFLQAHKGELGGASQLRVETGGVGVLRVLDSKDPLDKAFLGSPGATEMPLLSEFTGPEAQERFARLCARLTRNDVSFTHSPHLIRGLEYYNGLTFEFVDRATGLAVLAGGRYDALSEVLLAGSKQTGVPAIG
jgi:histidyl-tRNA synthetase